MILPTMMSGAAAFQLKVILFTQQREVGNFTHFRQPQASRSDSFSFTPGPYCAHLSEWKEVLLSRFADIAFLETACWLSQRIHLFVTFKLLSTVSPT